MTTKLLYSIYIVDTVNSKDRKKEHTMFLNIGIFKSFESVMKRYNDILQNEDISLPINFDLYVVAWDSTEIPIEGILNELTVKYATVNQRFITAELSELVDSIEEIKEKITDNEYKKLLETTQSIYNQVKKMDNTRYRIRNSLSFQEVMTKLKVDNYKDVNSEETVEEDSIYIGISQLEYKDGHKSQIIMTASLNKMNLEDYMNTEIYNPNLKWLSHRIEKVNFGDNLMEYDISL
jgi:hypothetical protein